MNRTTYKTKEITKGVISSNARRIIHNEDNILTLQTSLVINDGNSGGPIFNKNGELLGIISFQLNDSYGEIIQGVSFGLPISTIKAFI